MGDQVGWRNFWWLNVALNGTVLSMILFGFPETRWDRERAYKPAVGQATAEPDTNVGENMDPESQLSDKNSNSNTLRKPEEASLVGKGSPDVGQWHIVQLHSRDFIKTLIFEFFIPFRLMVFPIVQFAAFILSFSSSCLLMINLVQSEAFSAPPYGFSSQSIGFMNFAPFVGALIGLATAGPFSDWVSAWLTRRNNGIREPEMRLIATGPYLLVMILGNFVVGFGLQYGWDWRVSSPNIAFLLCMVNPLFCVLTFHFFVTGYCRRRLHVRRLAADVPAVHRADVRDRFIQAGRRRNNDLRNNHQECVGLWGIEVHHSLDIAIWLCSALHDEHVFDCSLVFLRWFLLDMGQETQDMDGQQQRAQSVRHDQICET